MESTRWLKEFEPEKLNSNDRLIDLGNKQILILGMGRIGTGAYEEMIRRFGPQVVGIENREESVEEHTKEGRHVILGDATDPDFWARVVSRHQTRLILLAMPHSQANTFALEQIRQLGYKGKIAAIARYEDEEATLRELGVDAAFNIYREAGNGFARHVCESVTTDIKSF